MDFKDYKFWAPLLLEARLAQAGSPENVEAITAFMQKREPDFAQFRK